jgi:hypothetical protein
MLLSPSAQLELFRKIDAIPEFEGAGVGYIGDDACWVLRRSAHLSGFDTWIVLEEQTYDADAPMPPAPPLPSDNAQSNLKSELVSMGVNCGAAVAAGAVSTLGVAAAPVTGGTSTIITLVAGAAAVASAAQCGISIGRVIIEIADPGSTTEYFDNEAWYNWASNILDALTLLDVVTEAPGLFKNLSRILTMERTTGKSAAEIIRGLSRQERKAIARELAKASEELSNKQWKSLVRAGKLPSIYTMDAIKATIIMTLLQAVGDVLTLYSSYRSGNIGLVVHIIQE